ncbi:MAG: gluconeogenesis factor YvcK family protein [Minisyncoccia bacterium]
MRKEKKEKQQKRIVVIGGGTGVFNVLNGLKDYPYHLSAIVSIADDGGSSGILRGEFGILPPGDLRRALAALSSSSSILAQLFNYRFENGSSLKGHSFGNLFITALERITGDFNQAIKEAGKILGIKGEVIPVSLDNTRLVAKLENNDLIIGESNIDVPKHNPCLAIKKVFLSPSAKANPEAIRAILSADIIIIGPGDLYTSVLPNFLVKGIKEAVRKSKAKKIYFCNIMTKYGETNNFTAKDFYAILEKYLGKGIIDYFVINSRKPLKKYLDLYKKENSSFVKYSKKELLSWEKPKVIFYPLLKQGPLLRHDPKKIGIFIDQLAKTL